jgi:UDP-glucose 4-epimerase
VSTILVTGGCGFIGSHAVVALQNAGREAVVLDNLSNSHPGVLDRIARITGRRPAFIEGDIRDEALVADLLGRHRVSAVIHFAGWKAVGESVEKPLLYYDNNVGGSIRLVSAMQAQGVRTLVFSSSATVYGDPDAVPIPESARQSPASPYGRSKQQVETVLADVAAAEPSWRIARLRYFNPVGAHESGLIGEDPRGIPNNLMPFVAQVAIGQRDRLRVFGGDYPTPDGTGVRDYVHVMDLAEGHIAALDYLDRVPGLATVNLGTGRGQTVLEVRAAFEKASGRAVPYDVVGRRPGDVAACWADVGQAERLFGWKARRELAAMCADAWNWQSRNPQGYSTAPSV